MNTMSLLRKLLTPGDDGFVQFDPGTADGAPAEVHIDVTVRLEEDEAALVRAILPASVVPAAAVGDGMLLDVDSHLAGGGDEEVPGG